MRFTFLAIVVASTAPSVARSQLPMVAGQVVRREGGQPLGFTTISVLSHGTQSLTSDSGNFVLRNLSPGEVRIRFKRIGFAPKDTVFSVAAGDTARIRIEMTRLVIELPAMAVNGTCTDRMPFEAKPIVLAELFDQVKQNAERMRLLANERPFVFQTVSVGVYRDRDNKVLRTVRVDTVVRPALPRDAYVPLHIFSRGEGSKKGAWIIKLPELPDIADTAFTNNHCLWYAGRTRFDSDSVIRVDFEPVPWLAKDVDLEGSIYLRGDGYQLVGLFTKLNKVPAQFRLLQEYFVRARFSELVSGVPVLAGWELTNRFRDNMPSFVETGRVTGVRWLDSLPARRDTLR